MTRREHAPEKVWEAQELYCVNRLTFTEVAKETRVAASTLKRWAQKFAWRDKLAQAEADLRADTILARSAMLKELITSKDAQTGFAVASLENLALKQAEAAKAGKLVAAASNAKLREIRTAEEAAAALEEAVELKLNRLLQSPEELDFKAVQDVRKAMALIQEMKPKDAGNANARRDRGLSVEAAQSIIDKVLGK